MHDCQTRTAKRHADSPKISINPSRRNRRTSLWDRHVERFPISVDHIDNIFSHL